jgi:hemerythrin superfamily protein
MATTKSSDSFKNLTSYLKKLKELDDTAVKNSSLVDELKKSTLFGAATSKQQPAKVEDKKVNADLAIQLAQLKTEKDIKEIHERIDTVLDKMQDSNEKIMDEFKSLRKDMAEHNKKEKESLDKLLEWKWMVAGGIIAISYLISHVNLDTILRIAK